MRNQYTYQLNHPLANVILFLLFPVTLRVSNLPVCWRAPHREFSSVAIVLQ